MLRVGLDTSPLVLTQAGTARYLTKLLEGLKQEPELEVSELTWGTDSRTTKVARDMFWYPSRLGRAAREAESTSCTARRCARRCARRSRSS